MKTPKFSKAIVSTKEVIGVSVKNNEKESLGKVEELVIDKVSGEIRYWVLSFGGFLGMGDKFFAIPWNAIHYDTKEDAFILGVSKEKLKKAPGFNKDNPPNYADQNWGQSIFDYYESKPYWH